MHLGSTPKEKEYKEALEAFNERNKEKAQMVARLMEVNRFSALSTFPRLAHPEVLAHRLHGDYPRS